MCNSSAMHKVTKCGFKLVFENEDFVYFAIWPLPMAVRHVS